ncbi:MAG: hypothetical protein HLUCCA04_03665 [Oceanicaulis sp. HLUCCA04]|nr:MAG: hypothetical protein HLUCCA04_03665 [Oceanicaulis sp. HLUCCA04]
MGRSVQTRNRRISSNRVGSVDWQDAMESFALYAALVEDEGAREVLMDMGGAEILISHSEAPELARMFARETPAELLIAIVRPAHSNDARFIEVFTEELDRAGRTVGLFATLEEADAFLVANRTEAQAGGDDNGVSGWFKRLISR